MLSLVRSWDGQAVFHLPGKANPQTGRWAMTRVICLTWLLVTAFTGMVQAQWWCFGSEADQFSITVDDSSFVLRHDGALCNCCTDSVSFEPSVEGQVIQLVEVQHVTTACTCLCCFSVSTEVTGLAPGTYQVELSWREYGQWYYWSAEVDIPDVGQSGEMLLRNRDMSPCLGEPPTPVEPQTWGAIKQLFGMRD